MSKKKKKYYTVWKGHKTGVFESWDDCKAMIKDFQGAQYKSFSTFEAAKTALNEIAEASLKTTLETQTAIRELVSEIQALKNNLMAQEAEAFEDIQLRRKRLTTELNAASKKMQEHDEAMSGYIKITRSASDAMSKRMMPALEAFTTHLNKLPQDATFQAARPKVSDIDDAGSDLSGGFKFNRGKKGPDA